MIMVFGRSVLLWYGVKVDDVVLDIRQNNTGIFIE
jgi:hypothetical protein